MAQCLQTARSSPSLSDLHINSAQVYSHTPHGTLTQEHICMLMGYHCRCLQQCVSASAEIYQFVCVCLCMSVKDSSMCVNCRHGARQQTVGGSHYNQGLAFNTQDNNSGAMKRGGVGDNSAGTLQSYSHTEGGGRAAPTVIALLRIVTQRFTELQSRL